MPRGMFMALQPFDAAHLFMAPKEPGVYVVHPVLPGPTKPLYVGRWRWSMHDRLVRHFRGARSRKIAAANKAG